MEGYGTVSSTCLTLIGSGGRGLLSWRPDGGSSPCSASCFIFHLSFTLLRLVLLWLLISALLRNYHRARAEMYRPAVDLQDYEMVELFLRRLKMWMGLSRAKEVHDLVCFHVVNKLKIRAQMPGLVFMLHIYSFPCSSGTRYDLKVWSCPLHDPLQLAIASPCVFLLWTPQRLRRLLIVLTENLKHPGSPRPAARAL